VLDPYTNSHKFTLEDDVWDIPDVQDVTNQIQMAAAEQDWA
jgi:hypothetical protein